MKERQRKCRSLRRTIHACRKRASGAVGFDASGEEVGRAQGQDPRRDVATQCEMYLPASSQQIFATSLEGERHVGANHGRQRGRRIAGDERPLQGFFELQREGFSERIEERVLGPEVQVDGGRGNTCLLGDAPHGDGAWVAAFTDDPSRHVQQLRAEQVPLSADCPTPARLAPTTAGQGSGGGRRVSGRHPRTASQRRSSRRGSGGLEEGSGCHSRRAWP